ncbi:hypothetical protein ACHAQA_009410 [Verticillium albo-atrum]
MSFAKFFVAVALPLALAADIFVATDGSNSGSGSIGSPYASIQDAVDAASAGDNIYLRAGTYKPSANIQIRKSGTSSNPYTIAAYEGEEVVVDGDNFPNNPAPYGGDLPNTDRGVFHFEKADYWRMYNLTFIHGPYGVYVKDSHNNYFERITTHDNYESGFHLQNDISNTEIVFLDSYMNADPRKNGKSADGISLKEGSGNGNIIRGARLWDNSDDGLDLWEFLSDVTILDCIVYGNGFNHWGFNPHENDGHGVKLGGGSSSSDRGEVNHVVSNVISFGNMRRGFTDNNMPGDMTFTRNTAWNNGEEGFNTRSSIATYEGNLAAENHGSTDNDDQVYLVSGVTSRGNSWDGSSNWSNSDFKSTNIDLISGPRQADGRIAPSDFLVPSNGDALGATTEWSA